MIGRRARRVNLEILIAGRLRWLLLSEEASVVVARHRNSLSVSIVPNLCPTRAHSSAFGHTSNAFLTDTAFTPGSSQAAHSDPCRLGGRPVRLRRIGLVVTLALGVLAAPLAAKRATNTIPIVMTNAGDPGGSGLVTSLGRPGGNVTGLSLLAPAVVGKQLELLKEVVPKVNRVAVLTNPGSPTRALMLTEAEAAMRPLGLRFQILDARGPGEFEAAFSAMTIGGGIGHLTRKCGLSIDNLLSVDMVLADGRFVTASAEENEDLFWAVRGGGGNFGVVTSFLFKLHPIKSIIGGPTLWTLEHATKVMKWYREFIATAPDDLNGFFAFLTVPPAPPFLENLHLKKMCGVVWCYTGPEKEAERVFKPIREFGPPALYGIHAMPHPMLQSAFDALYPPGLQRSEERRVGKEGRS